MNFNVSDLIRSVSTISSMFRNNNKAGSFNNYNAQSNLMGNNQLNHNNHQYANTMPQQINPVFTRDINSADFQLVNNQYKNAIKSFLFKQL